MADQREFLENDEGIHLMAGEFTLCGDAFDAPDSEADWEAGEFRPASRRVVTCPRCIRLINLRRGARIGEPSHAE